MPPRQSSTVNNRSSAAAGSGSATEAAVAAAPMQNDASQGNDDAGFRMPAMSFHNVKQYQALFVLIAHSEVRQRGTAGTLSTEEQRLAIMNAYKRAITLWYRDDATICSVRNMPSCPDSLRHLGSEPRVVRALLATTSTGNRSNTGASLLEKAKEIKKEMLKLIATWNVACKSTAQAADIAEPGTGDTLESVYRRMVKVSYRVAETLRVLNLRTAWFGVEFAQREFCTAEKIEEAHASHFYACRGYLLSEQLADTRNFDRQRRTSVHSIRRQINEMVESQLQLNGPLVAPARPPSDTQLRQSFVEVPMPALWDIEECYAFKVFGPPSGVLTAFWSEAWATHRHSTNIGAFVGRQITHNRQADANASNENSNPQLLQGSVGDLSLVRDNNRRPVARTTAPIVTNTGQQNRAELINQLRLIQMDTAFNRELSSWNFENLQRSQRIFNLQQAITSFPRAGASDAASPTHALSTAQVTALHAEYASIIMAPAPPRPIAPSIPQVDVAVVTNNSSTVAASTVAPERRVRARVSDTAESQNARDDGNDLRRQYQDLLSRYLAVELGGSGDCLFFVLRYLQDHEILHETLARIGAVINEEVSLTRARVADHLERRTSDDQRSPLLDGANIHVSLIMTEEQGSREDYLSWIRSNGASGGYIELVAWADMVGVRVRLFSTTLIQGAIHDEEVNFAATCPNCQTFFVLHIVGRGGEGGHYQLLQPRLQVRSDEVVQIAGESPSRGQGGPVSAPASAPAE